MLPGEVVSTSIPSREQCRSRGGARGAGKNSDAGIGNPGGNGLCEEKEDG